MEENVKETPKMGGGNTEFLDEISPLIQKIQDETKDKEGCAAIVLAGDGEHHSIMVCGRGGDIVNLMLEFATDDHRYEKMLMQAAKLIAIKGILAGGAKKKDDKQGNDGED